MLKDLLRIVHVRLNSQYLRLVQIIEISIGILPATTVFCLPISLTLLGSIRWLAISAYGAQHYDYVQWKIIIRQLAVCLAGGWGIVSLWAVALRRPETILLSGSRRGQLMVGLCMGIAALLAYAHFHLLPYVRKAQTAIGHVPLRTLIGLILLVLNPLILGIKYLFALTVPARTHKIHHS